MHMCRPRCTIEQHASVNTKLAHTVYQGAARECAVLRGGGCLQVWDLRAKRSVQTMSEDYQILSVAFSEAGDQIYTGGIENVITVWDLRKNEVAMTLKGHTDTITGLRVSPDGNHLLSNAMVCPSPLLCSQADHVSAGP